MIVDTRDEFAVPLHVNYEIDSTIPPDVATRRENRPGPPAMEAVFV
jgi:hypothetical protein